MSDELWIDTDQNGLILDWSPEALTLVGYAAKSARFRVLALSLLGDRPPPGRLARVLLGHPFEHEGAIRPRDRRAIAIRYRIAVAPHSSDAQPVLRWTFERITT